MTEVFCYSFAMILRDMSEVERALGPFYKVAAQTTGKGITVRRMKKLMEHINNPETSLRVVHIAGTSGKTSTTYYISELLHAANKKVGSTVSPHIDSLTERVQINGEPISEAKFCEYMGEFLELVEGAPEKPSWFELLVAFAFWVFAKEKVDYTVIETGLGGLHDATNIATAANKLCVITDIGIDHQRLLGDDLVSIASQKAGIIHEGNVVLMYEQGSEVMNAVRYKVAQTKGSELYVQQQERLLEVYGGDFWSDMPVFQRRNWLLSYAAYRFVAKRDGLKTLDKKQLERTQIIKVPARMEKRRVGDITVVMDGAHNGAKMKVFVEGFETDYPGRRVPILLAFKKDKDTELMAPILSRIASEIIVTSFDHSQDWPIESHDPSEVAKLLTENKVENVKVVQNPRAAFADLLACGSDLVVITGSFYLISQLRGEGLV